MEDNQKPKIINKNAVCCMYKSASKSILQDFYDLFEDSNTKKIDSSELINMDCKFDLALSVIKSSFENKHVQSTERHPHFHKK